MSPKKPDDASVSGFRLEVALDNKLVCQMWSLPDPSYVAIGFYATPAVKPDEIPAAVSYANEALQRFGERAAAYDLAVPSQEQFSAYQSDTAMLVVQLPEKARITPDSADPALGYMGWVAREFFGDRVKSLQGFQTSPLAEMDDTGGDINITDIFTPSSRGQEEQR